MLENLAGNLDCQLVTATLGHEGSLTFSPDGGFVHVPIFSRELIDTTGAGDAFLSIASAGAAAGWSPELIGFVGNVAGAISVQIVGNKESVEPIAFLKYISTLLK